MSNHFISLPVAIQMTTLYRNQKDNILKQELIGKSLLPLSETFDAAAFSAVLSNPDCKSLRIYYGMSDDLKVHAIIVGVNEKDEDIIPAQTTIGSISGNTGLIEVGIQCPPQCPPSSPLNG